MPVRDKEREEEIYISNGNWEIEVIKPVRQTASEHRNKPNYPKRSNNPRECHLNSTHLLRMKTCFNKELNLTNLSEAIASHLLLHCPATKLFTRQCHCYITWCFSDRASWTDYILITILMHWLLFIHKYYSPLNVWSFKCSSSEGYSCTHAAYSTVTLIDSNSTIPVCCMCTTVPPEDEHLRLETCRGG